MGRSLIGFDINQNKLRMVQLLPAPLMAVEALPEGLMEDGRILQPEKLGEIIRRMRREHRFAGRRCALILPDGCSIFRSISLPPLPPEQLKIRLPGEFRDYLGEDGMAYAYDYALEELRRDETGEVASMDILAAAAHKESMEEYAALLSRAGLRLVRAIPREMALVRLLRAVDARPDRARALVEFGCARSRIYIYRGTHLMASKVIDIGCRDVDRAMAGEKENSAETAAACREVYHSLALEVMKTVNFFLYENPQIEFQELSFCGEEGWEPLRDAVLETIPFRELPPETLLPEGCAGEAAAGQCLMALGLSV